MRIVFMGSCPFSLIVLQKLHGVYPCLAVYSAPPRPKGRGHHVQKTCVHVWAESQGIFVLTPESLRNPQAQEDFQALEPDVAIVASYGLILPRAILQVPRHGCLNIHPSLLPRWRGASPIASTIAAGDAHTGVCVMVMDEGMDTGALLSTHLYALDGTETTDRLSGILAEKGAQDLVTLLPAYLSGSRTPQAQSPDGVRVCGKIHKPDAQLLWDRSAEELARMVRAFAPLTWANLGGHGVKILQAHVLPSHLCPADGVVGQWIRTSSYPQEWAMVCGQRSLLAISSLRTAAGKTMTLQSFVNGYVPVR